MVPGEVQVRCPSPWLGCLPMIMEMFVQIEVRKSTTYTSGFSKNEVVYILF